MLFCESLYNNKGPVWLFRKNSLVLSFLAESHKFFGAKIISTAVTADNFV